MGLNPYFKTNFFVEIPMRSIKSTLRFSLPLALVFAFVCGLTISDTKAGQTRTFYNKMFQEFAEELLEGMAAANLTDITARGGYGKPTVAVLGFHHQKGNNSRGWSGLAHEYNTRLLAELIRQSDGRYRFIELIGRLVFPSRNNRTRSKGNLHSETDCISKTHCVSPSHSSHLHQHADIVVTGTLRTRAMRGYLHYRASGAENGVIYAVTGPRKVWRKNPSVFEDLKLGLTWQTIIESELFADESYPFDRYIKFLQRGLRHLGYRPGRITGVLNGGTRKAIRAYQWHHNLPVTGRFSHSLLDHVERQLVNS